MPSRISAERSAAASDDLLRRVWRLCHDRTCASTARLCASSNAAATARFQSIQSRYCDSTALHAHRAHNTKHNSFHTKLRSKSRG